MPKDYLGVYFLALLKKTNDKLFFAKCLRASTLMILLHCPAMLKSERLDIEIL